MTTGGARRGALAALALLLVGCPPGESTPTPPPSPPARPQVTEAERAAVARACGRCHLSPPPEALPRARWAEVIPTMATPEVGVASGQPPATAERQPWNPGEIPDEVLAAHYRRLDLTRARKQLEEGQVVELVRGVKPSAYFHTLCLNVRFLVPDNLSYTHCDCAEPRPCSHVPMAVWAFRRLAEDRQSGLVTTVAPEPAAPVERLDELERALAELAAAGIQGTPKSVADRWRRLEERLREAGLVWPAEALAELVLQWEAYGSHDARFSPRRVAELVGELVIRLDAIRAGTGAVPQLFIRGSQADRTVEIGRSQYVGLGCGGRMGRSGAELTVYLQDDRSGALSVIAREFPDPAPDSGEEPRELRHLALGNALTGISFATLGAGTLQLPGGKRTPSGRLLPGRQRAGLAPSTLQWEKSVRAPVMSEEFAELAARLAGQPPASLSPRRVASRLHVCAVEGVEQVTYSQREQAVYAALRDRAGDRALLAHPFHGRAHHGAERLVGYLEKHPGSLRLVSAEVSLAGTGLVLRPVGLVFEVNGARTLLQPWIDGPDRTPGAEPAGDASREMAQQPADAPSEPGPDDPVCRYPSELMEAAGEQWVLGLQRSDPHGARAWGLTVDRGAALGFNRLVAPAERLLAELDLRAGSLRWDPRRAARTLLEISALALLAEEQAG